MEKHYETIEGYFSERLGLDSATIEQLRSTFVEAR
jgi:hypothetical protein